MDQQQMDFDKAYWLHQPPEVRSLNSDAGISDPAAQQLRASQLAMKGFTIDVPIMVWGWDPYTVMGIRKALGYKWVPSALGPAVQLAPGLSDPGLPPYDPNNPPPGAIKVSIDPADYPPFELPAAPTHAPAGVGPVGAQSVGALYLSVPGDTYQDGEKVSEPRGTFLKHVTVTPFGRTPYWEKIG